MERYAEMFARLDAKNEGAFVPFVMIGDPDLAQSEAIICQLVESGADALELGIPYSDPIADGPTIQAASIRAHKSNVTVAKCLNYWRAYAVSTHKSLLVYFYTAT